MPQLNPNLNANNIRIDYRRKNKPGQRMFSTVQPLKKPYRLMIVDDHKFLVELLAQRLESDPKIQIVGMANRASAAIHIIRNENVDIVLLDMTLGEDDGITLAKQLMAAKPNVRIVGLSVHDTGRYPVSLLELGGCGFISKEATNREIIEGITRVANGEMAISPKIAVDLATNYSRSNPVAQLGSLTKREREVLKLIGLGYTIPEISKRAGVSEKTIHGHRASLKKKLKVKTDVELCLFALKSGLIDISET